MIAYFIIIRDILRVIPWRILRWCLDVVRGYTRAADGRERLMQIVREHGRSIPHLELCLELLDCAAIARATAGPLGVGARLAWTAAEVEATRLGVKAAMQWATAPEHASAEIH